MKRTKFLGVLLIASLAFVLAACVYGTAGGAGDVPAVTVPPVVETTPPPADVGQQPATGDWIVSRDGFTITVGTSYTYTNLATRGGADYAAARETGNTNVIMQYTFNADGSLASFVTIATGHGADGAASCSRWNPESTNDADVYPFLNRLIADGTVFPATGIDTSGRATYSKNAIIFTLNYAAANR